MGAAFVVATMARRGLLTPGAPHRIPRQFAELRRWGFGLAGELRQAAARSPRRVAVIDEARGPISYAELLDRSSRLACALPIAAGDRVGVLCRNSAAMIETLMATTMAGADPVLINTGLSASQLAAVITAQSLKVVVHDDEFAALLPAPVSPPTPPVSSTSPGSPPTTSPGSPPTTSPGSPPTTSPGSPATTSVDATTPAGSSPATPSVPQSSAGFIQRISVSVLESLISGGAAVTAPPARAGRTIVLTSGTTGTPKGARRPTPAGFSPLCSIIDRIPLRAGMRIMISAPLFHTWGLAGLQIALALRATVVLRRRFEPAGALETMSRESCAALIAVPVMLQNLLEVTDGPHPPLTVAAVSGSALPGGLATRFMDRYGDILYNLYGSTEASWASIATPADLRAAPGTAGRPPYGTAIAVLDGDGKPVAPGTTGRLFVGNEMLFEGYTNGSGRELRDGLLATGDLGHVDADGRVHVDGREDDMIVSGGENVFPSEVEGLLADLPGVREVAVIGVPDDEYGQRLAAYVVLNPSVPPDADAIRDHVRRNRARFCVPRDIVFLAALPRNATGKVLKRELPR